ncbi:helix-turn-helix domain-containing protein [Fischerella sp. PCC 9605]|uniref:helix-turn-helix domain-containing protein n=1 Tax=Fischerella sp. PCC 9605 TaxID=1173024 RepID=UPI0022AF3587|nr:helix-turn-helix domain-containing protein [Fischerella sp. PCC 9605]
MRIYPNKEQEVSLAQNFGCARFVWNFYLNKTNTQYEETGKGMTYCQMASYLTQLKKLPDYEWLQEPTAAVLQQSLKRKSRLELESYSTIGSLNLNSRIV